MLQVWRNRGINTLQQKQMLFASVQSCPQMDTAERNLHAQHLAFSPWTSHSQTTKCKMPSAVGQSTELRRASRLSGPAPNCEISSAPPSMVTFFRNIAICICAIIGLFTAQKLCIISVTGTRKNTSSQAPALARYPRRMLSPPASARIPDAGTNSPARGTPACAA